MSTRAEAERRVEVDLDALREGLSPAVRTIRVTYPDLHGTIAVSRNDAGGTTVAITFPPERG